MEQQLRVLQQQELPPEAEVLASTHQLGKPRADYRVGLTKWMLTYIIIGIVGVIICAVLAAITFNSPNESDQQLALLCVVFAVLCGILAVRYLRFPLLYRGWHVFVCDEGFIFSTGKSTEAFRWDQIEGVWQELKAYSKYGMRTGVTHKYTVRRTNGAQVEFDDRFVEVETLAETIMSEVKERMLPRLIAAFQAGETLHFGPVNLNMQGVSNGKERLPWEEIRGISTEDGHFRVRKEGKLITWAAIEVAKIPNIDVLDELIRHLTSRPGEDDKKAATEPNAL